VSRLGLIVATFGYLGFFPIAPGTAGSLAALVLYAIVRWVNHPVFDAAVIAAVFGAGVWAASRAEEILGVEDPGPVVIDEVLGMLMTLAWMPLSLTGVITGFLLFRILDVVKPFPAGRLEHAPRGWGIMLDDAMAGVYGQLALRVCMWAWPAWMIA
jgi:phosphatidylglycerophosphatase A